MSALPPAKSKAISNRVHALRRAQERYQWDATWDDLHALEEKIRAGDAPDCRCLRPDSVFKSRTLWGVKVKGRWMAALYDGATESILTFLPEEALNIHRPALDPQPAAAPAEPKPAPVYGVVGFVKLPDPEVLPDLILPGETPTIQEIDRCLTRLGERIVAVRKYLDTCRISLKRRSIHRELERLYLLRKTWRTTRKKLALSEEMTSAGTVPSDEERLAERETAETLSAKSPGVLGGF